MSNTSPIYNFAAGPSVLADEVLKKCSDAILEYSETPGESILSLSHRSAAFKSIIENSKQLLTELLDIPSTHQILFLQGGGTGQFTGSVLNLLANYNNDQLNNKYGHYLVSGTWSLAAYTQAKGYNLPVKMLSDSREHYSGKFNGINTQEIQLNSPEEIAYFYYCANETVNGVEAHDILNNIDSKIPIICDMSSNIMARKVDFKRYSIVFGGAQKNLGPAGVTIAIVHDDVLKNRQAELKFPIPTVFDYSIMAKNNSLYNTPPTFAILALMYNLEWIKKQGGLKKMIEKSQSSSQQLYEFIDKNNKFYKCPVNKEFRSWTNVVFNLNSEELEQKFIKSAKEKNLINLNGHRSIGGIRVSLYNGLQEKAVTVLVEFMQDFLNQNDK
ncbi:phosphoserine aminotransferase [Neoconidiobolus thromboides FSU 785]|nr:phosphoserine aminotransferase [Neoconidiobolus thromboides FSU 785]